jgi:hypothetical protein
MLGKESSILTRRSLCRLVVSATQIFQQLIYSPLFTKTVALIKKKEKEKRRFIQGAAMRN